MVLPWREIIRIVCFQRPLSSVSSPLLVLLALSLLLLHPHSAQGLGGSRSSLFELSAHVTELSEETLAAIEADPTQPWAINAYSPACPHCQHFASTWEEVGELLHDTCVRVGALNCTKHRDLCRSLKVTHFPSLLALNWSGAPIVEPGSRAATKPIPRVPGAGDIVAGIQNIFSAEINEDNLETGELPSASKTEGAESAADSAGGRMGDVGATCRLRMEDAVASIRWFLKDEVFINAENSLDKERLDALHDFLKLLATTFPGPANRASFRDLDRELRRDHGLNDIDRWDERMRTLEIGTAEVSGDAWTPDLQPNWPAANLETSSAPLSMKYTSGLWALFHALSVSESPIRQKPYEVVGGIHSFVDNFFRCAECRKHFLEMYEGGDNGLLEIPSKQALAAATQEARPARSYRGDVQLALWLWRTHNAVNTRLAKDSGGGVAKAEAEVEDKSLWPQAATCPQCWNGYSEAESQPPWHENNVVEFLKATYWCPEDVGEGQQGSLPSWTFICLLGVCSLVLLLWARRWAESRGVGLSKKRADQLPPV